MDIEIYQISSYIWGRNYNLWCSGCGKHGLDCSLVKRIGFMASQILLASFHSHLTRISRRTHLPFRLDQREVDYIFCICNNPDHQEGTEYQQSSMSLKAHLHQLPPKHTQWKFWQRNSSASPWLELIPHFVVRELPQTWSGGPFFWLESWDLVESWPRQQENIPRNFSIESLVKTILSLTFL